MKLSLFPFWTIQVSNFTRYIRFMNSVHFSTISFCIIKFPACVMCILKEIIPQLFSSFFQVITSYRLINNKTSIVIIHFIYIHVLATYSHVIICYMNILGVVSMIDQVAWVNQMINSAAKLSKQRRFSASFNNYVVSQSSSSSSCGGVNYPLLCSRRRILPKK